MADRVGQLFGNYRLIRLLGSGGFAEVYLGQHMRLPMQQAALKILSTRLEKQHVRAFELEAETIASLIHPHIVRILDFDVAEDLPFLVMDYAPNGSLRHHHKSGEQVALLTVVSYVQQIADGLQYAHDRRIIHRDIKPDNMLIGSRNEIMLSDFGVATIAHSTISQGMEAAIGTVPYMAPEQLREQPRPASDQYALAISVYEWLAGYRPFTGTLSEIAFKQVMLPPPPLREKRPDLAPEVEQVVLTALAKDPKERFASIQAFSQALAQASQAAALGPTTPLTLVQTIQPPPPIMKKETRKPHLSRRAIIVGSSVAALVAVVGGGLAISSNQLAIVTKPITTHNNGNIGNTINTYTGHTEYVSSTTWSPDSQRIASAGDDHTVRVWNASNGGTVYIHKHHWDVYAVAWSPDGQRLASSSRDKTVHVWNASDGGNAYIYRGHTWDVYAVAWSPDNQRIASAGQDTTVQIWNAHDGGHVFTYYGHNPASANTVAWSPNGRRIASGGFDNTVQVWNASDGGNVYTYREHSNGVLSVAWSPDGQRIASAGYDNTVQVWNASDGGNVFTYRGHSNHVTMVAWSPNGQRIASASWDGTVQVWSANDGGNVYTYNKHTGYVWAAAWSHNGKYIASGGNDTTVRVWSAG
jgi:eukaryotic-like serine/threonine-protein kinase